MGNLADELDFADEDWEQEENELEHSFADEETEDSQLDNGHSTPRSQHLLDPPQTDGARDSGIDMGYRGSPEATRKTLDTARKVSALHHGENTRRPSSRYEQEETEGKFSLELEDAMSAIARLADPANDLRPDTTSRTVSALQDLTAQTTIESHSHRLSTSMDSVSAHLTEQTKFLQSVSSSIFSPFAFASPLDAIDVDEVSTLVARILQDLPTPDVRALQGLNKLDKETGELLQVLSALLDSLQMGKQAASNAARHLRVTQSMASELRREREQADEAMFLIEKEDWDRKLQNRQCAAECRDVVSGFERVCNGLRKGLEESAV